MNHLVQHLEDGGACLARDVRQLARGARKGAGRMAGAANDYACDHPWRVAGVAAALGALIALLARPGRR